MPETHPFGNFVPRNAHYLILGSFTGKEAMLDRPDHDPAYTFIYGTRRNQFWPMLEAVYGVELKDTPSRKALLTRLGIAMADIILICDRKNDSNLDANLIPRVYNTQAIDAILTWYPITKIFFTSQGVATRFKQNFKEIIARHQDVALVTLPSPSPRYARLTREAKIARYRALLPEG